MLLKKENGVTLIALAVTIIVLLIISGITLGTLQNKDSIVKQAKDTGASAGKESIIEKIEADLYQEKAKTGKVPTKAEMKKLIQNKGYNKGTLGDESFVTKDGEYTIDYSEIVGWKDSVEPGQVVSETKKDNYIDEDGNCATIPKGFIVDKIKNKISEGLVVYSTDNSEFVWIPVPDINNMSQCSTAGGNCNLQLENDKLKCIKHNNEEIVGKLYAVTIGDSFGTINTTYNADSATEIREPAIINDPEIKDDSNIDLLSTETSDKNEEESEYKSMATSVAKYGGFYVGRYETSLSDATASSEGTSGKAQSKQGVKPVTAGNTGVGYTWHGLYKVQKEAYEYTNSPVNSNMIWGSQYDRIINWALEGKDKDKVKSESLGEENRTITGSDKNSNDSINNIRDLCGNMSEATQEGFGKIYRQFRGGDGVKASYRGTSSQSLNTDWIGSRLTLYIK